MTDRDALLGRISFTTHLGDLSSADLVIEAIPERLELKRELFGKLDEITPAHTILASNTSSLSVTDISVATKRPAQVVGLHFFNPAPVQAFVEVVRTVISDDSAIDSVVAFAESLGKKPVVIGDKAGFIANALLFGYLNHAVSMFEQKYASREDIDDAMRLGCGYPMGPLALVDLIGLTPRTKSSTPCTSRGVIGFTHRRRFSSRWSRLGCEAARADVGSTPTKRPTHRW
jgi:3-hydroxybutyryl-CoA dehydrogenase